VMRKASAIVDASMARRTAVELSMVWTTLSLA